MGLFGNLFGSGPKQILDNPEFGNSAEYSNALERIGLYAKENPNAIMQFFSSPAGKKELQKLGYSNPADLARDASSYSPNVATSNQYGDIANGFGDIANSMSGMGDSFTDYGSDFNYSSQDLMGVPDQAYQDMLDMQNEQASRGFKGALNQLGAQYGGQGFRPGSGLERASGSGLGRNYLEQLSNISRDVGMQKANSRLDMSKFASQQDIQRQQMQQQANMQRANYLTELQNYSRNFGLQGANTKMSALNSKQGALGAQTNAAMLPYQTAYNYWDRMAINQNPTQGSKGIISKVAGGIGDVAKGAAAVGGLFL